MYKRVRRSLAHSAIKNYLECYLPAIGMGVVKTFICEDFSLGQYRVFTSKGNYRLSFLELTRNGEIFKLWLNNDINNLETMTFSITGFGRFKIKPKEMTINNLSQREVIDLQNGTTRLYIAKKISLMSKINYIEFSKTVFESSIVDMKTVLEASK